VNEENDSDQIIRSSYTMRLVSAAKRQKHVSSAQDGKRINFTILVLRLTFNNCILSFYL